MYLDYAILDYKRYVKTMVFFFSFFLRLHCTNIFSYTTHVVKYGTEKMDLLDSLFFIVSTYD